MTTSHYAHGTDAAEQQRLTTMNRLLNVGGLVMNSADPVNTIGSVLTRRFNDVGDIVKIGRGTWGLKEWYPNRSFKKEKGENGDTGKPKTVAP